MTARSRRRSADLPKKQLSRFNPWHPLLP